MAAFMNEIKQLVLEAQEINFSLDHRLAIARKELKQREESTSNLKAEFEDQTKLFKRKLDDMFNEDELRQEIRFLCKRLEVGREQPARVVNTDEQKVTSDAIKIPPSSSARVAVSTTVVGGEDVKQTLPSSNSSKDGRRVIDLSKRKGVSEASKIPQSSSARVSDSTTAVGGEDKKPKSPSPGSDSNSSNKSGRIINLSERASINSRRRLATASPAHGGGRPIHGGATRSGTIGRVVSTNT